MKILLSKWAIGLLVIILLGYGCFTLTRALPNIQPTVQPLSVRTLSDLSWPSQGESAVSVIGTNILDTNGQQVPKPTASTAKLITALVVLKKKPINDNVSPTITLTQADVNLYKSYLAEDGSVVPVQAGEQISEYQMLEAMLLPSANNMADSLAIWAYGSLSSYASAANSYVKSLGLTDTTIGSDASGFQPNTVSTASDLAKIGRKIMQNPTLANIVSKTSAEVPVAGTIYNVNSLLGKNNVIGIKTGNTDQAGGVFVGAASFNVNGSDRVIVTANVGANDLKNALSGSAALLQSAQSNFRNITVVKRGTTVAEYKTPWSKVIVKAVSNKDISAYVWGGDSLKLKLKGLVAISYKSKLGDSAGSISIPSLNSSSATTSLSRSLPRPSIFWRLSHP